jgi:hypothetical protein
MDTTKGLKPFGLQAQATAGVVPGAVVWELTIVLKKATVRNRKMIFFIVGGLIELK